MRRALLAAWLLGVLSLTATGAAAGVTPTVPMAHLLSPADGAELTAGSLVTIEWKGLDLPPRAHEWEAFLSVDGGRTWPLRVTPHLDLSIRRFSFRVPGFPTRDARLLLRFGDEEREVGMEAPQRFVIVGDLRAWRPPPGRVLGRGERARENGQGTVIWVEGSREGGDLREVVSWSPDMSLRRVEPAGSLWIPLLAPGPVQDDVPPPAISAEPLPLPRLRPMAEDPTPRPASVPVRLLMHRFNE